MLQKENSPTCKRNTPHLPRRRIVRLTSLLAFFTTCALLAQTGFGQPYTPTSDDSVVETLPNAIVELSADIRRTEAARAQTNGISGADILQRAMNSYQLAVASGDPRAYGRTLSILQRWPADEARPAMIHVLLAAVLQHNHDFAQALTELQHVTAADPDSRDRVTYIQALMIQSQIGLVTGDYPLVEQSCSALQNGAPRAVFINCKAQLDGVTGNAQQGLDLLADTLRAGRNLNPVDYQELMTTAAVLAHRLDQPALAEGYYQSALRLAPDNPYLVVNYSTMLLEQDRADEVVTLLSALFPDPDLMRSSELNILLARALLATGLDTHRQRASVIISSLEQDFELAFLRSEAIPHKEYAQYALELAALPAAALHAAQENWRMQKDPSDTLLLAKAAAANNDLLVLEEIEQWLATSGLQDARLQAILANHQESAQ